MGLKRAIRSHPLVFLFGLAGGFAAGLCCSFRRSRSRRIYHQFADQQTLLGIPNFWNVVSNLPFILVGAMGLASTSAASCRPACSSSACS